MSRHKLKTRIVCRGVDQAADAVLGYVFIADHLALPQTTNPYFISHGKDHVGAGSILHLVARASLKTAFVQYEAVCTLSARF